MNDPSTRILTLQQIDNVKVYNSKVKKRKSTKHVVSMGTKQKEKNRYTSKEYQIANMGLTKQVLLCWINQKQSLVLP